MHRDGQSPVGRGRRQQPPLQCERARAPAHIAVRAQPLHRPGRSRRRDRRGCAEVRPSPSPSLRAPELSRWFPPPPPPSVLASPVEMFKIRMQAQYTRGGGKRLREVVGDMYREYGWRKGIMRGYWVRAAFCPVARPFVRYEGEMVELMRMGGLLYTAHGRPRDSGVCRYAASSMDRAVLRRATELTIVTGRRVLRRYAQLSSWIFCAGTWIARGADE